MNNHGQTLDNGLFSDTNTFGHKIEPDICYLGGSNFAITYTSSTQQEVHLLIATLSNSVQIDEIDHANTKLLNAVDLLGKSINSVSNKPLLYIYDDGSVERRVVID